MPRRDHVWRANLTTEMAVALGVTEESLVHVDQATAAALGIAEESRAAKREAIRLELHALARSGVHPDDLREAVVASPIGQTINKALGGRCH